MAYTFSLDDFREQLEQIARPSRRQRIANGSGVSPREVTDLIKQFDNMASLMKGMADGGVGGAMDTMRKLRREEPLGPSDDDEPWDDRDILGEDDAP